MKNPQYDFPKMRGGGQRPFGTFPKIHPFWSGDASLSPMKFCDILDFSLPVALVLGSE